MKSKSGMLLATVSASDEFANLQWKKKSLCDSIHIALGHCVKKYCNCLTFMNKGVVLILCKVVVCAAVGHSSTFWKKVLSIFKIAPDSYSLSLFTLFKVLYEDM